VSSAATHRESHRAIPAVVLPFLVSRVLFLVLTPLALHLWGPLHLQGLATRYAGAPGDYWYRWDAVWYLRIATDGYQQPPYPFSQGVVFFPLYPSLLHVLLLFWPWSRALAAVILTNLCCLGVFLALYRVVELDYGPRHAARSVWLLALFPTSLFLFAGYSESLFLLLFLLCCYLARLHRWWWAGLAGGLATATRSVGIVALLPFAVSWYEIYGASLRHAMAPRLEASRRDELPNEPRSTAAAVRALSAVLLIPAGIGGYALYLGLRFGHPLLFSTGETAWRRAITAPWRTVWLAAAALAAHPPAVGLAGLVGSQDSLFLLVFLVLSLPATVLLTRAHALVLWGVWLVALSTPAVLGHYPDPLISLPRYLLAAFPLFIFLAATPRRTFIAAVCFSTLLVLNTIVFLSGGWVA